MAKLLSDLKMERTTVKRLFSRLVNCIWRTHTEVTLEELQESFKKLTLESSKVMEANDEVEAAYMAECDAATAEELSDPLRADIEKTEKECEQKTKEVKLLIRETLWARYGEKELSLALQIAEAECRNVSSTQPGETLEAYEFILTHLEELVRKAKAAHQTWDRWAPSAEREDFSCRIRELEVQLPKLVSRKAAFIEAASSRMDPRKGSFSSSSVEMLSTTSYPEHTTLQQLRGAFWKKMA